MMEVLTQERWFLYAWPAWWLLINGAMYYLAFDFLLRITEAKGRQYVPLWLVTGGAMTICAVCCQIPGMFLLYVLSLIAFGKLLLKIPWAALSAPAAIVFTLHTFIEGESAVILAFLSANAELEPGVSGWLVQGFLSLVSVALFFLALLFIRKKYAWALRQPAASCLYVLLLPCGFFVFLIRWGLKLDRAAFAAYLSSFGPDVSLTVLFGITAAGAVFFLTIGVFCKIVSMSGHERAAALLREQLEGQKTYIEEAGKRNEAYASFQHDLDNHLLVLSGLLREQRYEEAARFAEKLHDSHKALSVPVSTGDPALDVLLKEKISHARRKGIAVSWDVGIPKNFQVEGLDLCVIFANIMDNAVCACGKAEAREPLLSISTKARGDFLVIEGRNPANVHKGQAVKAGTGLSNIRAIAEKYHGTMELETGDGMFRISVLLCSGRETYEQDDS